MEKNINEQKFDDIVFCRGTELDGNSLCGCGNPFDVDEKDLYFCIEMDSEGKLSCNFAVYCPWCGRDCYLEGRKIPVSIRKEMFENMCEIFYDKKIGRGKYLIKKL